MLNVPDMLVRKFLYQELMNCFGEAAFEFPLLALNDTYCTKLFITVVYGVAFNVY